MTNDPAFVPELAAQLNAANRLNLNAIVQQLRSPLGVIPFVGAGLSVPFRFPQWGPLLEEMAFGLADDERAAVSAAVERKEFEAAAAVLQDRLGGLVLQRTLAESFQDSPEDLAAVDLRGQAIELVPLLASGLVITTNYDRALEFVFERAGQPFVDRVFGANPTEIIPAIQQNRLMLWKIHGDRTDSRTRVLSGQDYVKHYAELPQLLALAFENRPALFLGCSLDTDRTMKVLAETLTRHPGTRHFALLQAPETPNALQQRNTELAAIGVSPIWFPKGGWRELYARLAEIAQRASAVPLRGQSTTARLTPASSTVSVEIAAAAARETLSQLITGLRKGRTATDWDGNPAHLPFLSIVESLKAGRVVFFLGAGADLNKLPLAKAFYRELRRSIDAAPADLEDAWVAQTFVDRNRRDALTAKVNAMLNAGRPAPTAVHWFIATLGSRLRAKGLTPRAPVIFSTNFDDWMEDALGNAGERFHLFTYRLEPPHEGQFVYRSPDGGLHVVDRPAHFRHDMEDVPIVVKYHGGLHADIPLPASYAFTRFDFVHAARHLPYALPSTIMRRVAESSLLFLGHGLRDESVEALVRRRSECRRIPSWAVQRDVGAGFKQYWSGLDVQVLDVPLERFIPELDARIDALAASVALV